MTKHKKKSKKHKKQISFFKERKNLITILVVAIIFLGILSQAIIFYVEKITSGDLKYVSVSWSEYCDGKIYTLEEKQAFCNACLDGTETCDWPLDINVSVGKVERTLKTNGEIHCFLKIDEVNYYREKGSYYGVTEPSLFTWQVIDASKPHNIQFCCGIERESLMNTIFHLEKSIEQGCIATSIPPRCNDGTIQI